jgi:hypothetical protein
MGRKRYAKMKLNIPKTDIIRKIDRQPDTEINIPPNDGPKAVPTADIVPISPIALPDFISETASLIKATERAVRAAAPRP